MKTLSRRPQRVGMHASILAGLLVAGMAAAATPALADWDSIAVDDDVATSGGDAGFGVGTAETKSEAEAEALKACKNEGNKSCSIEVSYKDMCAAYASSRKYAGHGIGETKAVASARAKDKCGDAACKVVVADCVGDD